MEISITQKDQVTIIMPVGEIDALNVGEFSTLLNQQLQAGKQQLIADLSQVTYMSSAGLRAFLTTLKETRRGGGDFRLAAIQASVRQVLDMTGFTSIFKIFPTVDMATASFDS
ncbi:anti-sigma factor antagonist [soil metagenome]